MKLLQLLFILFSLLVVSSCSLMDDSRLDPITETNLRVVNDQQTYQNLHALLDSNHVVSDPFSIDRAEIIGNELHITVTYSGGCQAHDFELVWPEVIPMIYPYQFDVLLLHQANQENCEALIEETLIIDLLESPLLYTPQSLEGIRLSVVNGSQPEQIVPVY